MQYYALYIWCSLRLNIHISDTRIDCTMYGGGNRSTHTDSVVKRLKSLKVHGIYQFNFGKHIHDIDLVSFNAPSQVNRTTHYDNIQFDTK